MNKFLLMGTLAATVLFASCDKQDDEENVNEQDKNFTLMTTMNNRAEIDLGNLALTKSNDASVKNFAQLMVTDHTMAQTMLEDYEDDLDMGLDLAVAQPAAFTQLKNRLSGLSGRAFDSVYMRSQVEAHALAIATFQTEINAGGAQRVKSYASEHLPKIQMHKAMADTMYIRVK